MIDFEERLEELEQVGADRRMRLISGPQGPRVLVDGRPVLLLCSDNVLGLADHPRVREATCDAAMRWGLGAGAARLVSGNMTVHRRLEEQLAEFHGSQRCVVFGSEEAAAAGALTALTRPGDVVLADAGNHPALADACRLSPAETLQYDSADMDHLAWGLRQAVGRPTLVVCHGVRHLDGHVAPLAELVELARRHDARVVLSEARATGALGPGGRGAAADAGVEEEIDVLLGSLGGAFGSYGGFVVADRAGCRLVVSAGNALADYTAAPPPVVAGAIAALELLREQPERVDKVRRNARVLRDALAAEGLAVEGGRAAVMAIRVRTSEAAALAAEGALEHGVLVDAVRPPVAGSEDARVRLAVMSSHTRPELRGAAHAVARALAHTGEGEGKVERGRVYDGLAQAA